MSFRRITVICGLLTLLGMGLGTGGCASHTPSVREVSHRTITHTITAENEALFVPDRASHIRVEPVELPIAQQREEFRVRWTSATIATVKLQYRQVNRPNAVQEQTFPASGKRFTIFRVAGNEFKQGGNVSAWRVSLWTDAETCVAEQHSATW